MCIFIISPTLVGKIMKMHISLIRWILKSPFFAYEISPKQLKWPSRELLASFVVRYSDVWKISPTVIRTITRIRTKHQNTLKIIAFSLAFQALRPTHRKIRPIQWTAFIPRTPRHDPPIARTSRHTYIRTYRINNHSVYSPHVALHRRPRTDPD